MSTSSLPMLSVPRVAHSIRVDGDLHKAPWTQLAPTWLTPAHGRSTTREFQSTALRVCHDGERLYVAFDCEDRAIVASHTGRNAPLYEEDVVEAFFAPDADPRHYFELETSPRNAWFEARVESPDGRRDTMRVDRDWVCADFTHAARVTGRRGDGDESWSAEWSIPFASLGVAAPRAGDRWRANFFRIDQAGGGEYSAWSPTHAEPPDFHLPHRFGVLVFE
ncbi:MAG: carbohydrate-binding family 9-like protein [Proteobacteria bacterium]|nr:carbohydrate-binding family 9-like protein [Pseudomonadota bacterium]